MLSVLSEDMASFERSVIQLKVYYGSLSAELGPSPLHYPILGTRLLQLLVENRMAEFHNEVRSLRVSCRFFAASVVRLQLNVRIVPACVCSWS